MANKSVLVLSEIVDDTDHIESTLRSSEAQFEVTTVYNAKDAVSSLKDSNTDLLVFNLKSFSTKKLKAAVDLRKMGLEFPLISLANQIDEAAYQFVSKLENSVLLGKPYKDSQLLSLSEKMSHGEEVIQRRFPRFVTEQAGLISAYPVGQAKEVKILNLSKGGACIELETGVALKRLELVRLKVFLSEVGKTRELIGRVSWVKKPSTTGLYSIGLKFVSEAELFRSLLSAG